MSLWGLGSALAAAFLAYLFGPVCSSFLYESFFKEKVGDGKVSKLVSDISAYLLIFIAVSIILAIVGFFLAKIKKLFGLKFIYFLFPEIIDDWRSRQGSADYRSATPVMRNCLVMAVNEDLTHCLPKINMETLLIWGDRDTATPIGDAKIMEEKIKGSGLVVLEGGTHYCFLEQPQKFKGIMRAFFGTGAGR